MRIENMSSFLDFISKIGRLKHDLSRTYYRSRKEPVCNQEKCDSEGY